MLNVAWTFKGLKKLDVSGNKLDIFFNEGQVSDAAALGDNDPHTNWVPGLLKDQTDGAFLIASSDWAAIDGLLSQLRGWLGSSIVEVHSLKGAHRPGAFAGHEHFGYLDGIVRDFIMGFNDRLTSRHSKTVPACGRRICYSHPPWTVARFSWRYSDWRAWRPSRISSTFMDEMGLFLGIPAASAIRSRI